MVWPAGKEARAGELVWVQSRVGRLTVPLEIRDHMMEGVVSLPHGWSPGGDGVKLAVAQAHPGASANDLTDDAFLDELSGTTSFHGVPVAVAKCAIESASVHAGAESSV